MNINYTLFEKLTPILSTLIEKDLFIKPLLHPNLKKLPKKMDPIFTDFTYGVVRYKIFLQYVLKQFVNLKNLKKGEKALFFIALYGVTFRKDTKVELFINDLIEWIKDRWGVKKGNFFNGVLRNYLREKDNILKTVNKIEHVKYSIDKNFHTYLKQNLSKKSLIKILNNMVEPPQFYFRINSSFSGDKKVYTPLKIYKNIYRLPKDKGVDHLSPYLENGEITIQDISAQLSIYLLEPKEGEIIADICSAPGTKTSLISELSNSLSNIDAIELDGKRYTQMVKNLKNHKNITCYNQDGRENLPQKLYNKIVLDPPCSALGTVSKNPDKKYRFSTEMVQQFSKIQKDLIDNAISHLAIGGIFIYVVCTFTPQETDQQIEYILKNYPNMIPYSFNFENFSISDYKFHTERYIDGDIFFIARFKKGE